MDKCLESVDSGWWMAIVPLYPATIYHSTIQTRGPMIQPEHLTESFVVRIWLEPREIADAQPEWRGVIEHVASGKRKYILDLDNIVVFMAEYMQGWGVKPKSWALLRQQMRCFQLRHLFKRG